MGEIDRQEQEFADSALPVKRGRGRPPNILQIAPARDLPDRVRVINEYHESAMTCLAQGAMYAILCGFELIAARSQTRHGQWETWVEEHCPFSSRTAIRYMEAAQRKYKDIPNLTHVSDFALGVAPHTLQPEQRMQLIDAVKFATDGESVRQLYLELGLVKSQEPRKIGGDTSMYRKAPALPEGETVEHVTAVQGWNVVLSKLNDLMSSNQHIRLTRDELQRVNDALLDAKRKIAEALKD